MIRRNMKSHKEKTYLLILWFIEEYRKINGFSPHREEIAKALQMNGSSVINKISELQTLGVLSPPDHHIRSISLTEPLDPARLTLIEKEMARIRKSRYLKFKTIWKRSLLDDHKEEIKKMLGEGRTAAFIAEKVGCTRAHISFVYKDETREAKRDFKGRNTQAALQHLQKFEGQKKSGRFLRREIEKFRPCDVKSLYGKARQMAFTNAKKTAERLADLSGPVKKNLHQLIWVNIPDRERMERSRYVMEQVLKRPLTKDEFVLHRNGRAYDDRPENLQVVRNQSEMIKAIWDNGLLRRKKK